MSKNIKSENKPQNAPQNTPENNGLLNFTERGNKNPLPTSKDNNPPRLIKK